MTRYVTNKKVGLSYSIEETFEAGMELHGYEVKSVKKGLGSLEGARVVIRGGEAFLLGAHIPAYQPKNAPGSYDPYRTRRLLLNKKEIVEIATKESSRNLTTIPLALYNSKNRIKAELGLCKRKTKADKRQTLRKKDDAREMRRISS